MFWVEHLSDTVVDNMTPLWILLKALYFNLQLIHKDCSEINFRSAGKFKPVIVATHILCWSSSVTINLNTHQFLIHLLLWQI